MRKRHSSITMLDIIIHTIKCVIFNQRPGCQNYLLSQQEQHRIRHMQTFQNIPYPLLSPSTTSLTADNFANYFTRKTTSNSSQLHSPMSVQQTLTQRTIFCPPSFLLQKVKCLIFSYLATPQYPLISPASYSLCTSAFAHTHHQHTHLFSQVFPTTFKQARVTPLPKKPTLDTALSPPSVHSKITWTLCVQPSVFLPFTEQPYRQ